MFEQAFKNIDDVLRKEAGCTTELDYTEQTSWLLFLKYLDGLEQDLADEAALERKKYAYILDKPYRWEGWAAPRGKDGTLDHNRALTGDDLRDFVNQKLFPYLHGFKARASGSNTIEYKIGEIFGEVKNKIQSGYNMREIIDHIDGLRFRSSRRSQLNYPEGVLPDTGAMMPSDDKPVVHSDPQVMGGTPVFVGTRVPFQTLLDYLEAGDPLAEFLQDFPTVSREQAVAALEQAKDALLARAHSA